MELYLHIFVQTTKKDCHEILEFLLKRFVLSLWFVMYFIKYKTFHKT